MNRPDPEERPSEHPATGSDPTASSDRRRIALQIGALLALALVLRLFHLDHQNFWIDEVVSLRDALPSPGMIIGKWMNGQEYEPLFFLLLHPVAHLTESEFWARLPSVAVSVAEVGIVYQVGRTLRGRRTGLLAALLLAISPLHVWYAQEVRWYAWLNLIVSVSFLAFIRAWTAGGLRRWLLYGGAALVSIYMSILAWTSVAAQAIAAVWTSSERLRWGRLGGLALVFTALALLAFPSLQAVLPFVGAEPVEPVGTPRPAQLEALPYTIFAYVAGYSAGPSLAELHNLPSVGWIVREYPEVLLYGLVFVPLLIAGIRAVWKQRIARSVLVPWAFGVPIMVYGSALLTGNTYNVRYALPGLTGSVLIIGAGIDSLLRTERGWLGWVALAAAAVLSLFSLSNHYWSTHYHKADVRSAVHQIAESERTTAPVFVVGQVTSAVEFYGEPHGIVPHYVPDCPPSPEVMAKYAADGPGERPGPDRPATLWLLVGRDWDDEARRCIEHLRQEYRRADRWSPHGVELHLFRRSSESSSDATE